MKIYEVNWEDFTTQLHRFYEHLINYVIASLIIRPLEAKFLGS